MSKPPKKGEPIKTAAAITAPNTMPTIMNRLFIFVHTFGLIKTKGKRWGKDLEEPFKIKTVKIEYV